MKNFNFSPAQLLTLRITALVAFLQILWPPKVATTLLGVVPAGRGFLFTNSTGNRLVDGLVQISIDGNRLLLHLVLTLVVAGIVMKYLEAKRTLRAA